MIIQGKVEGNLHNFTVCTCAQLVSVDTTNVMIIQAEFERNLHNFTACTFAQLVYFPPY